MFDFDVYARASRQAAQQFQASTAQTNESPYLPPQGKVARRAELRKQYDATVSNIMVNCQAEIDRGFDQAHERDSYIQEKAARTERELLSKLPSAYVAILDRELASLSAPQLVARLAAARDDSEKLAVAKIGAAVLRARPANPDGSSVADFRAMADFERLATPPPTPEWTALAADVHGLALAKDNVARLDIIGYEEGLRKRYGIDELRESPEPDAYAIIASKDFQPTSRSDAPTSITAKRQGASEPNSAA